MNKINIVIITSLLLLSCKQKERQNLKTISHYPNKTFFKDSSRLKIIHLNQFENFKELVNSVNNIFCNDSIPVIEIENKSDIFNFIPMNHCPDGAINCEFHINNNIVIDTDSIFSVYLDTYKINNLDTILNNHILNPKKNFRYADSPEKAYIHLKINNKYNITKTEDLLINIFSAFNKVRSSKTDSLPLRISLKNFLIKDLPPPPPPPKTFN